MIEASIPGSIELTYPLWMWLLPAIILLTYVLRAASCRVGAPHLPTAFSPVTQSYIHPLMYLLPKNNSAEKISALRLWCYLLVLSSLVLCLTEPVRIGEKLPDPPPERDIVFIVDSSVSMSLRDYMFENQRVDRMTMLKGVLDRFIQKLAGERMAIIVFADNAYTLVPLTRDQYLLRRMSSRLQTTMAGRFNNVGEAISLAVKQTLQSSSVKRHRVLVLLTDADKPTGSISPLAAAELALDAGVPLYSIAIGANTAAAEEKRSTGLIYEPVDLALLTAISERTGARSYQAGDVQTLERAIAAISQHETNKRELAPRFYRQALYHWPLLFALTLVLLLSLLSIVDWRRRFTRLQTNRHSEAEIVSE